MNFSFKNFYRKYILAFLRLSLIFVCAFQQGEESQYDEDGVFECLPCAEGCESCEDDSPCVVSLNWLMRTAILILECCVIACLPAVALFTWKYGNVKASGLPFLQ